MDPIPRARKKPRREGKTPEAATLRTIEAALAGESEPVDKEVVNLEREDVPLADRRNVVFLGTSVAAGKGLAFAVETRMGTEQAGHPAAHDGRAGVSCPPQLTHRDRS